MKSGRSIFWCLPQFVPGAFGLRDLVRIFPVQLAVVGTHPAEIAFAAFGAPRLADGSAESEHIHMKFEGPALGYERSEFAVRLLGGRFRADQAEPPGNPVNVNIDREKIPVRSPHERNIGGFYPDSLVPRQKFDGLCIALFV